MKARNTLQEAVIEIYGTYSDSTKQKFMKEIRKQSTRMDNAKLKQTNQKYTSEFLTELKDCINGIK
jgi:membrane protease subunit (stomatin/prohibitin family)